LTAGLTQVMAVGQHRSPVRNDRRAAQGQTC